VEPEVEVRSHFCFLEESDELNIFGFWFWICNDLDLVIWLCGYLFVFCICVFFNKYFGLVFFLINILDFYLGLLILYPKEKAKGSKSIKFFFEK
jgi:hypothetical protein